MFYADGEKRSQNFCCAADVEQAAVNFRHVSYNIEQNPRLLGRLHNERVNRSVKTFEHKDGSMFKVLSSIAETKHGLSPNFVYVDEVHAHRSGELIDVMVTGTAGRSQPLIVYTTTADFDRVSVCNDMYARAKSIALGQREEATFLPVIYEASVDEDFNSYNVWVKANPNFGVSIYPEYFERQIQICRSNPSLLNRFLRLHLNIRTKTETVWIPPWVWANGTTVEDPLLSVEDIKCKINQFKHWHNYSYTREWTASKESETYINDFRNYYTWYFRKVEELRHSEAWGGYDNTASSDIASFVLYFPTEGIVLPWFWVPAESISRRSIEERIPYDRWHKAGLINNTPLACISEIDIGRALTGSELGPGICEYFTDIRNVSYDRWGSNFVYETLYNYGVTARPYPQSFAAMNEPCRKLETMITNSELFHGGNPILDWMMNNSMVTINNNNQKRVDKNKSTDKVDGIVAFLMAIGGHIYTENNVINSLPGLDNELV
jgi:phage terminase large subunit-like protein